MNPKDEIYYWNFDYEDRLAQQDNFSPILSRQHSFAALEVFASLAYPQYSFVWLSDFAHQYYAADAFPKAQYPNIELFKEVRKTAKRITPFWGETSDSGAERAWNDKSYLFQRFPDSRFVLAPASKDAHEKNVFVRPRFSCSGQKSRVVLKSALHTRYGEKDKFQVLPFVVVLQKYSIVFDAHESLFHLTQDLSQKSYFSEARLFPSETGDISRPEFGLGKLCQDTDFRAFLVLLLSTIRKELPKRDFSIDFFLASNSSEESASRWYVSEVNLRKTITLVGHRIRRELAGEAKVRLCLNGGAGRASKSLVLCVPVGQAKFVSLLYD